MTLQFCFVCNIFFIPEQLQSNLAQIKSQYSGYPLVIFIKKFLRKSIPNRNINDPNNCICDRCFQRVSEYDDLCVKAKRIEDELHKLLVNSDRECQDIGHMSGEDQHQSSSHESEVDENEQIDTGSGMDYVEIPETKPLELCDTLLETSE